MFLSLKRYVLIFCSEMMVLDIFVIVLFSLLAISQQEECSPYQETTPYITLYGRRRSNHSFFSLQGVSSFASVVCNTEVADCCDPDLGGYIGQWVLPNGSLVTPENYPSYIASAGEGRVDLNLSNIQDEGGMEGLYRCDIILPNVSVDSVYVGLYRRQDHGNTLLCTVFWVQSISFPLFPF